jgi:hypothetical protein
MILLTIIKYDVCVFVWAYVCSVCCNCAFVRYRLVSDDGVLSWFGNWQGGREQKGRERRDWILRCVEGGDAGHGSQAV